MSDDFNELRRRVAVQGGAMKTGKAESLVSFADQSRADHESFKRQLLAFGVAMTLVIITTLGSLKVYLAGRHQEVPLVQQVPLPQPAPVIIILSPGAELPQVYGQGVQVLAPQAQQASAAQTLAAQPREETTAREDKGAQ